MEVLYLEYILKVELCRILNQNDSGVKDGLKSWKNKYGSEMSYRKLEGTSLGVGVYVGCLLDIEIEV